MTKEDIRKEFGFYWAPKYLGSCIYPLKEDYINYLENKIIELDKQIIRAI